VSLGHPVSADHCESTDRERSHSPHFDRDGKEAEVAAAKVRQAAKVFDDGNARSEEPRMDRPAPRCRRRRVIDVDTVDSDQHGAQLDKQLGGALRVACDAS
jgi:hypothetical protein